MHKSCDKIYTLDNKISYNSENPGIFTDAYCYLPWIAQEYGLKLPADYVVKDSCRRSQGNRRNINQSSCSGLDILAPGIWSRNPSLVRPCNFSYTDGTDKWDRCRLLSQEGYAYNIYQCKVRAYLLHHYILNRRT